jgi:pyruvate formate lyase activating enzyme
MSSAGAAVAHGSPDAGVDLARTELRVGGLVPLSACDFPEKLAAVVFCQGCPWRCRYCHNPHLQPPRAAHETAWGSAREWLARRRGLLDAVVFSGGEPSAQAALPAAMKEVRDMGFLAALHTAGVYPRRLERALRHADWVGFDVKTEFASYPGVTDIPDSGEPALDSLRLLLESGVPYEVRTTIHPDLVPADALLRLARALAELGVRRYVLQEFRGDGCVDAALRSTSSRACPDADFCGQISPLFDSFELRRA